MKVIVLLSVLFSFPYYGCQSFQPSVLPSAKVLKKHDNRFVNSRLRTTILQNSRHYHDNVEESASAARISSSSSRSSIRNIPSLFDSIHQQTLMGIATCMVFFMSTFCVPIEVLADTRQRQHPPQQHP